MGAIDSALAAKKVPGLKSAFVIDNAGKCQQQGGSEDAFAQSAELIKQIYDIVSLPEIDRVCLVSDDAVFCTQVGSAGMAGAVLAATGDSAEAQRLLESLLKSSTPAGAMGQDAMASIKKLAAEYLKDFAEMALMVQMKQSGVSPVNPDPEALAKLVTGLEKAAVMIVGPSVAQEMGVKMRGAIK